MSESPQPPLTEMPDDEMLRAFLTSRDVPCPACGYNLRLHRMSVCPACGLPLKLAVGNDTPFKLAWAITLCINAMIAGAGLLLLSFTTAQSLQPLDGLEYIWWIGPMVWVPTPLIILGLRKWFCRQSKTLQYTAVWLSLCWLLVIGGSLLLTI